MKDAKEHSKYISKVMNRGGIVYHAEGAYSHSERDIIYMNISSYEINKLKNIVLEIDKTAFITMHHSKVVSGHYQARTIK